MLMKPTVYIETTIPSYLVAKRSGLLVTAAHQQSTQFWWEYYRSNFECYISAYVVDEISLGNPEMAQRRLEIIKELPVLENTESSEILAQKIKEGLNLPEKASLDAYHIAIAAVHGMDFLLTWNCTHINNLRLLPKIELLCRSSGFSPPVIGTPEELF